MAGFAGFPTESEIRAKIVEYGRRLYDHGYVVTNDGNISARVSEDEIIATPTGVSKGHERGHARQDEARRNRGGARLEGTEL